MTTTHLVLRYAHISMGLLALASGAAAMTLRKGSPLHRQAGNVFFVSMLIMAGAGTYISIFITPVMPNIVGGSLTMYMVLTAWAAGAREPGTTGKFDIAAALFGLTIGVTGITFGIQASNSPTNTLDEYPAAYYFIFGGAALPGTLLDVRMIARGGFTGARRLTRHLSRMCIAMFMATASFFLGQAKLFPVAVRESGVLRIPVLLVIGALLYWLIRVRLWPSLRKLGARRLVRVHP